MKEYPLHCGTVGSLVWVMTTERLVIAHISTIPAAVPSTERINELVAEGWRRHEVARMYGTELSTFYAHGVL